MTPKKVMYIIPGFKHRPTNKAYKTIAKMLKSEGYTPVVINIPWRKTTISENITHFLKEFKKLNSRNKYILGFSFGAMIAFIASTKVRVSGLILCSLSPYFKEDLSSSRFHCATLAKQIKAKQILMLYGAKEERPLIRRVIDAYDHIPTTHKYLIPIKQTEHDIGDRKYLHKIHQVARELL